MKKITQEQTKAVMNLLAKYNVGVQEYSAVEKMFSGLPVVEEIKVESEEKK